MPGSPYGSLIVPPAPQDRADYRLEFVDAWTGRRSFLDLAMERPFDPSRTCRNHTREGVEARCAALIPEIARRAGIDVTRIEGRITELARATTPEPAPLAALIT